MLTSDLLLQPVEGGSRQLLLGCAVCEGIGDGDISEVLEDGALHRQFVQVGIQEGYDALGEGRGAVEIHGRWLFTAVARVWRAEGSLVNSSSTKGCDERKSWSLRAVQSEKNLQARSDSGCDERRAIVTKLGGGGGWRGREEGEG